MPHTPDDEFTELVDATIPRVDLVDKAANGTSFLIAKGADGSPGGLITPDFVRGLIGKTADTEPEPAADPSIVKEAAMATPEDLDPTVVLADPDEEVGGNANTPGSPAWEAVDAATARKWTAILSRAKTALLVMEDRELLESAAGDVGAYDSALDLDNAACAIDYAISVLAPFAVDEQAEVDAADLEMVGKALAGYDPTDLDVIESLTQVAKAGRSLSASNERAIRDAVESLTKVLASLPAAPEPPETGRPVTKKETDMPETGNAPETVDAPAVDPIGKADGDGEGKPAAVAVYDAKGKLVGIVAPTDITPISGADAVEEEPEAAPEAPAPAAADLEPAPAAAVGVPAEEVAKTTDTTTTDTDSDILKSSELRDVVKGLLDEHSAGQKDVITKQGEALLELAELVETLKGQVRTLEEQPAEPRVFANGAQTQQMLRGQDRGAAATQVDMAKARELKRAMYSGTAPEQNAAAVEMQTAAIDALKAIHRGA
jgi:hypothetical protein